MNSKIAFAVLIIGVFIQSTIAASTSTSPPPGSSTTTPAGTIAPTTADTSASNPAATTTANPTGTTAANPAETTIGGQNNGDNGAAALIGFGWYSFLVSLTVLLLK